jgi:hypothetical protein
MDEQRGERAHTRTEPGQQGMNGGGGGGGGGGGRGLVTFVAAGQT